MSRLTDIVQIAHHLMAELGERAALTARSREHDLRDAGEHDGADMWADVFRAIRAIQAAGRPVRARPPFRDHVFDQRLAFEAAPPPHLLLDANLRIVGANAAYLHVTMTKRRDIMGHYVFDVFPDNPELPGADGTRKLGASLARVLDTGRYDLMTRTRYDIRNRDGVFVERWWVPLNIPLFDDRGRVETIVHCAENIAPHPLPDPKTAPRA